jgi:hypothetical protein
MKTLSTLVGSGILTLSLSASALAGPVGISRSYPAARTDTSTIAELQQASETALREARDGNKNNPAFVWKSSEDENVIARLESGQRVNEEKIDDALQPVSIW